MLGEIGTTTIVFLIGVVTAILLYLLVLSLRNPVLARLGLRNMVRRPTQTVLIIVGLTLSTIIIVSSLGTGDTLRYSVQKQAVAAYGQVDEIIAPPLLSMFANMANPNVDSSESDQAQETLDSLTQGGLDSVLALVQGGLPSISMARLEQLRAEAAVEPLIDGVAGSIVFPTIVRNVNTGQSEPLGFIFAVDDEYSETFGLTSVEGVPLSTTDLEPGIGNIFLQAANVFAIVPELASQLQQFQSDTGLTLDEGVGAATVVAGVGALLTGVDPALLPDLAISMDTLDQLGVDTQPLRSLGRDEISLPELATLLGSVDSSATTTETLTIPLTAIVTDTAILSDTARTSGLQIQEGALSQTQTLASLGGLSTDLLSAVNLNTLGYQLDATLAPFGLQLRQGDLYLNRLGADRLDASVGDLLEVYIGPLPVRFRVRAIVDEAGPLSALTPVVMLRLDEAQKLLFMNGQVNSVLVSNLGDELSSMQHTDAVSKRLSVLAQDTNVVSEIATYLRQPDVQAVINAETTALPEIAGPDLSDEDIPPIMRGVLQSVIQMFDIEEMTRPDAVALMAAVDANDDNLALRELLARQTVRTWLLELELPEAVARPFATAVVNLNQFEQIEPLNKTTIVAAANVGGGIFSSIFSIFGVFSILAALLLIVLIFVMLSAERRVEIGVARAIGVQRSQIVQMFMTEGMAYNLLAAALGIILGIAISFGMTQFIGQLFNDLTGQINSQAEGIFTVSYDISWQSVVIAYCLGVIITWLAMTITSWQVSKMNIVAAIRNLPDEAEGKRRSLLGNLFSWIFPLAVIGLGIYLFMNALSNNSLSLAMIAATVSLYGATTLVGRLLERTSIRNETGYRIVYTILGAGLIAIWIVPWSTIVPQLSEGLFAWDITQAPAVFTIGGPLIIIGAILVIMFNADLLGTLASNILGFIPSLRPVLKTAVAYPLSTRFRTGMTMVLFAMIMATVVVMAVIIDTTQSLTRLNDRQTAGFEIEVAPTLLSFFNPIDDFATTLAGQANQPLLDQIEVVGLVTDQTAFAQIVGAVKSESAVEISGVSNGYLAQASEIYRLTARAPGYADDAAVWAALQAGEDVVIAKPSLLRESLSPFGSRIEVNEDEIDLSGEREPQFVPELSLASIALEGSQMPDLTLELRTEGQDEISRTLQVQVIGVLADDTTLAPGTLLTSETTLRKLRSVPVTGDRIYIKVSEGADVPVVAAAVEQAFVSSALDATVLAERQAQTQRLTQGALQLLQGFMALGLLVGIAALGVISTRSVIERRQQVGMLRALGYQKSMVGISFLLESSFVSITGLLIGALTGIVLGQNIVGAFFPEIGRAPVSIPWLQIGLIVLAAYLFSLLTTLLPAWQASRIYPAEALRYE